MLGPRDDGGELGHGLGRRGRLAGLGEGGLARLEEQTRGGAPGVTVLGEIAIGHAPDEGVGLAEAHLAVPRVVHHRGEHRDVLRRGRDPGRVQGAHASTIGAACAEGAPHPSIGAVRPPAVYGPCQSSRFFGPLPRLAGA